MMQPGRGVEKERIRKRLLEAGACAVGFAYAAPVGKEENQRLDSWVERGMNAGMAWMERHRILRRDLNNVLPGVRTVISVAFPYAPARERSRELPYISHYAYGPDYHKALRSRLTDAIHNLDISDVSRICIDSAPVSERYWAIRCGIGVIGDNGSVIIPGIGSEIFLAEVLTTLEIEPDMPSDRECLHCGACRRACPTGALQTDGTIDCRRCISYLTIEHRGEWSDPVARTAMTTPAGRNSLFGCDRCMTVCPMNIPGNDPASTEPMDLILNLMPEQVPDDDAGFKAMFRHTALLRPGRDGLMRNIRNLENH